MVKVVLLPAVPEDIDFLYGLNRATMREYVVETWGRWDERWQRSATANISNLLAAR